MTLLQHTEIFCVCKMERQAIPGCSVCYKLHDMCTTARKHLQLCAETKARQNKNLICQIEAKYMKSPFYMLFCIGFSFKISYLTLMKFDPFKKSLYNRVQRTLKLKALNWCCCKCVYIILSVFILLIPDETLSSKYFSQRWENPQHHVTFL